LWEGIKGRGDSFGIPGEPTEKRAMVKLSQLQKLVDGSGAEVGTNYDVNKAHQYRGLFHWISGTELPLLF